MIDLEYAKKAFENYLNDYDQKNEKIKLKMTAIRMPSPSANILILMVRRMFGSP